MGIDDYASGPLRPFARWSRLAQDEACLETSRKLSRYLALPKLWIAFGEAARRGRRGASALQRTYSCHTMTLRGLLEYGEVTRDVKLIDFVTLRI